MSRAAWMPGQVIGGRYTLEERLGAGSTAQVWRARDQGLRSLVALKLLEPAHAGGEIAARLLREARAAATLRSLHVVQILDHGLHQDRVPYIVMELLEGETLAERLERQNGRLTPAETVRVLGQVGRAVAKAHAAGIIHRDLKPQNIFLVHDDEDLVKVFDFGIAKVTAGLRTGATAATRIGSLLGTPEYMSPEQARGDALDFRTDLWSMGVIGYQCAVGALPFDAEDIVELLEKIIAGPLPVPSRHAAVPPAFDVWFATAASRDPSRRFASAKALADALADALRGG